MKLTLRLIGLDVLDLTIETDPTASDSPSPEPEAPTVTAGERIDGDSATGLGFHIPSTESGDD